MTNDEIATLVDTSDDWISQRTGIRERRLAADDEGTALLGARAARPQLENAGIDPAEIDLIVAATASPDYYFPATASLIGTDIGAGKAAATTCRRRAPASSTRWPRATRRSRRAWPTPCWSSAAEVFSRLLDWSDRSTCILFGDGAGAVVLGRDGTTTGMLGFDLGADGKGAGLLSVPAAGNAPSKGEAPYVQMNGPEVYKFATHVVVESAMRCLDAAGLTVEDVDLFLPHQANQRIIDHAARRLGIPEERVFGNVAQYGNTSAASIPLALDEAYRGGDVNAGDTILMVGFGGGLAWGSCVMEWTKER